MSVTLRKLFAVTTLALSGAVIATSGYAQKADQPAAYKLPVASKTYLINGLVSAIPFIGYGMANLKKKIHGASLYSYVSPVEGSGVIQPKILREIRKLHRRNPSIQINLIGISYGATMVTSMSAILAKENIAVNYLGVIDGRPLTRIHSNVARVDNFTCTFIDCIGVRLRFANGNSASRKVAFKIKSTHINLGNNKDMHNRIIQQISMGQSYLVNQNSNSIDQRAVGSIRSSN